MKGDKIILQMTVSFTILGVGIFAMGYLQAHYKNEIFLGLAVLMLIAIIVTYVFFDSRYVRSAYTKKDREALR